MSFLLFPFPWEFELSHLLHYFSDTIFSFLRQPGSGIFLSLFCFPHELIGYFTR